MPENYRKILIIRTDRIGDVILTLPMASVLKEHFPDVHITMMIQRYTSDLVQADKHVDEIVYYDNETGQIPFFKMLRIIKSQKYDVVFHTHPRFRIALITWLAGIPERVGTGYRWYSFMFNNKVYEHRKNASYHELEYNLHLLEAIGCSVDYSNIFPTLTLDENDIEKVSLVLKDLGVEKNHKIVILHPGSGRSSRDWSRKNFGILGKRLTELSSVKVLITGGKNEEQLVDDVRTYAGSSAIPIVNRFTLKEYAALVKSAALFISNSTGPIHIAAAVGTMVIGLYPQAANLSAARWGPYTNKKIIFTPIGKDLNCKKCFGFKNSSCECMDSITVDEVFQSAKKYLLGNNFDESK